MQNLTIHQHTRGITDTTDTTDNDWIDSATNLDTICGLTRDGQIVLLESNKHSTTTTTSSSTTRSNNSSQGVVQLQQQQQQQRRRLMDAVIPSLHQQQDWFAVESWPHNQWIVASKQGTLVCIQHHHLLAATDDDDDCRAEIVGEFPEGLTAVTTTTTTTSTATTMLVVTTVLDGQDVLLTLNTDWQVVAEVELSCCESSSTTCSSRIASLSATPRQIALVVVVATVQETTTTDDDANTTTATHLYLYDTLTLAGPPQRGRMQDGSGRLLSNILATVQPVSTHGDYFWAVVLQNTTTKRQSSSSSSSKIAFVEPNGLQHGPTLSLNDDKKARVLEMKWNGQPVGATLYDDAQEEGCLAVAVRNDATAHDCVQLWYRCNYHWYLQREIRLEQESFQGLQWKRNGTLWIKQRRRQGWDEYTVERVWSSVSSSGSSTAFVVDGKQLQCTPLAECLIPPPMCAETITFTHCVNEVALIGHSTVEAVLVLSTGTLILLGRRQQQEEEDWSPPNVLASFPTQLKDHLDSRSMRNITLLSNPDTNDHLVLSVVAKPNDAVEDCIFVVALAKCTGGGDDQQYQLEKVTPIHVDGPVLCQTKWLDEAEGCCIQLDDGRLMELDAESLQLLPSPAELPLEPCSSIVALKHPQDAEQTGHERLIIARSRRGRLYAHDIVVADSVSSFLVCPIHGFLIYVTAESRCWAHFVNLGVLAELDPLAGSDENNILLRGFEPRNVERGARLVAVLPNEPVVVLQQPRGNLETIYPHALVLCMVMKEILNHHYAEALEMMRRLKVDLNLIVDVDPDCFVREGAKMLIDQISNTDRLNLFISSLRDEDTTATKTAVPSWVATRRGLNDAPKFDFSTKTTTCCALLRSAMTEAQSCGKTCSGKAVDSSHFRLPILSTFAKESPPRLEEALKLIRDTVEEPRSFSSFLTEDVQSAIKYLAFMAEYEQLFDTALGFYDFDLARAVARNSQMDPKSYLPLLKRYSRQLPTYFARYEVDVRLSRFDSALRNLDLSRQACESRRDDQTDMSPWRNSLDDCLEFMEEHALYSLALQVFSREGGKVRNKILNLMAGKLLRENSPTAALNVAMSADSVDSALAMKAAKACGDWETYFCLPGVAQQNGSLQEHASNVASVFAQQAEHHVDKNHCLESAARIALEYAKDPSSAVEYLVQSENWAEAFRISVLHEIPTNSCMEAVVSWATVKSDDLAERTSTFPGTMQRYLEVLAIRKKAVADGEEWTEEAGDDNASLFSTASATSNTSVASASSVGSFSSVISAKSQSSFSISGAEVNNRHKSKYNKLGSDQTQKRQRKKKKNKKGSSRIRPGSHEELLSLVSQLRSLAVTDALTKTIGATVTFLVRHQHLDLGSDLFVSYQGFRDVVASTVSERPTLGRLDGQEPALDQRIEFLVEKEISTLSCPELPSHLVTFFQALGN